MLKELNDILSDALEVVLCDYFPLTCVAVLGLVIIVLIIV